MALLLMLMVEGLARARLAVCTLPMKVGCAGWQGGLADRAAQLAEQPNLDSISTSPNVADRAA